MASLNVDSASAPRRETLVSESRRIALGIFFLVLAVYVVTSPGRIDIIDGQVRFDVALHWLMEGRPLFRDPVVGAWMGVVGRDGATYSYFGPAGSIVAMPLILLGAGADKTGEVSRFLFTLTSCIFGALIAAVLYRVYLELGVSVRRALAWTTVSALATMLWPADTSTFENVQHAFFSRAAFYLALLIATRRSRFLAVAAGLTGSVLILYQEYFLLVVPALGIAAVDSSSFTRSTPHSACFPATPRRPRVASLLGRAVRTFTAFVRAATRGAGDERESIIRYACFSFALGVAVVLALLYNDLRFGSWYENGRFRFLQSHRQHPPFLGHPIAGVLTLVVSPGKSVFLYCPPLILGLLGIAHLYRRRPQLALTVVVASTILVLFISCISFVGGDWCWGPRYLVPLLPLWALAFPFLSERIRAGRPLMVAIIGAGVIVQAAAVSVETQTFFMSRGLNDFFWGEDPWVYFKRSALFARVGEIASLHEGVPATVQWFNSLRSNEWVTYTILGPPPDLPRARTPQWMRQYAVFYLPRPWMLWMCWIPPASRPINVMAWSAAMLGLGMLGFALIRSGLATDGTTMGKATSHGGHGGS